MFVSRNENGKLQINTLDLDILVSDIFDICNNEHEVEFVLDALTSTIEDESENKINNF